MKLTQEEQDEMFVIYSKFEQAQDEDKKLRLGRKFLSLVSKRNYDGEAVYKYCHKRLDLQEKKETAYAV